MISFYLYKEFFENVKNLVFPGNNKEYINADDIINEIQKLISNNKKNSVNDIHEKWVNNYLSIDKRVNQINIKNFNQKLNNINNEFNNIKQKYNCSINTNLNNSLNFVPESISPENMYKLFMYCVRQFEYEEKIYNKFLTEEDFIILKKFVGKINKYIKYISKVFAYINKRKKMIKK